MDKKIKKSFLSDIPGWGLSLVTALLSFIFIFAVGYPFVSKYGDNIGGWITYLSAGILIAIACFFICKKEPSSFWYTPVIANVVGIISAVIEPNFWITSMWMPFTISWILSFTGAFSGAWAGRRI